jgi:hypothetical protein
MNRVRDGDAEPRLASPSILQFKQAHALAAGVEMDQMRKSDHPHGLLAIRRVGDAAV